MNHNLFFDRLIFYHLHTKSLIIYESGFEQQFIEE